jgi:hypothetical protein
VVSLSQAADSHTLVLDLLQAASWTSYDETAPSRLSHALYPKHKAKAIFVEAKFTVDSAVETANMCDILLLVVHASPHGTADDVIDQVPSFFLLLSSPLRHPQTGREITSALRAVGLPQCVAAVQGLRGYDETALSVSERKSLSEAHKLALQSLETEIHTDLKMFDHHCPASLVPFHAHCPSPATAEANDDLLRSLFTLTPKDLSWRSIRSHLLVDSLTILPRDEDATDDHCSVRVSGYLRGCPLLLHSLVQLKGVGAGRIVSVTTHECGPIERADRLEKQRGRGKGAVEDLFADKTEVFRSDPSR